MTRTARNPLYLLLIVLLAVTTHLFTARPASAAAPGLAHGYVTASGWTATTAEVCAEGYTDDAPALTGLWTLTASGAGTGGPIALAVPVVGTSFPFNCYPVTTGIAGGFTATLTYTGVGLDVVAVCTVVAVRVGTHTQAGACSNAPALI